jgi:hypothetical protein
MMATMYEASWRQLRRVRLLALSAVFALLPLIIFESQIDPRWILTPQLVITFSVWAVFWGYAVLRYQWWLCPRCRRPFQTGLIVGPWSVLPREKCINCGLPVGS